MNISQDMAREMQKLFPSKCKIIKINMLYEDEVLKYIMGIEEAHNKASKSTLHFP